MIMGVCFCYHAGLEINKFSNNVCVFKTYEDIRKINIAWKKGIQAAWPEWSHAPDLTPRSKKSEMLYEFFGAVGRIVPPPGSIKSIELELRKG